MIKSYCSERIVPFISADLSWSVSRRMVALILRKSIVDAWNGISEHNLCIVLLIFFTSCITN
jgi:hypothetical protein